jgi:hypothetical protein
LPVFGLRDGTVLNPAPWALQALGRHGDVGAEGEGATMPRGRMNDAANTTTRPPAGVTNGNGANLGFEAQMFLAADKLRKNLEPSDYKHVALGLIFLNTGSSRFLVGGFEHFS